MSENQPQTEANPETSQDVRAAAFLDGAVLGPSESPPPKPLGRPRQYDDEVFYQICSRVGRGEKLSDICAEETMPAEATVFRWIDEGHGTAWHYALLAKYERRAEECIEIADNSTDDLEVISVEAGDNGQVKVSMREKKTTINRAKLQIDTRLRIAAKMLPRVYGDPLPQAPPAEQLPAPAPGPERLVQSKPTSLAAVSTLEALRRYDALEAAADAAG